MCVPVRVRVLAPSLLIQEKNMTWNYRIMRRFSPESPETFWFEIVEVFYGQDGVPMMFGSCTQPVVSNLELEIESDVAGEDLDVELYVKESLIEQFTMIMRDTDSRGPILDERDFDKGGVYADHPEVVALMKKAQDNNEDFDIRAFIEEDDDEDEQL